MIFSRLCSSGFFLRVYKKRYIILLDKNQTNKKPLCFGSILSRMRIETTESVRPAFLNPKFCTSLTPHPQTESSTSVPANCCWHCTGQELQQQHPCRMSLAQTSFSDNDFCRWPSMNGNYRDFSCRRPFPLCETVRYAGISGGVPGEHNLVQWLLEFDDTILNAG